jgi:hypothetical protein
VREFPDVFAIPRATTTRPPNEKYLYALTHQVGCGEPGSVLSQLPHSLLSCRPCGCKRTLLHTSVS